MVGMIQFFRISRMGNIIKKLKNHCFTGINLLWWRGRAPRIGIGGVLGPATGKGGSGGLRGRLPLFQLPRLFSFELIGLWSFTKSSGLTGLPPSIGWKLGLRRCRLFFLPFFFFFFFSFVLFLLSNSANSVVKNSFLNFYLQK